MVTDIEGRTVLVTGGAGFIGSHIVDALVPDNEVRVLDNLSTGVRTRLPDAVTLFDGDIRDERLVAEAMADVDLVFHQAALVSVRRSVEKPVRSHEVNSTATLRLLQTARREDARVVLASSAAIYGPPETVPIPEDEPPAPTTPYGVQKLTLDRYAQLYHDLYGVETVALRYFNVYGPRQSGGDYSGVIRIFVDQARSGTPITVEGDGTQTRDFVFVDDVVEANLCAATTSNVGRAYNVGTGERVSIRTLAEMIRDATDSDSRIVHRDPRPAAIEHSCAETSAARSDLGYRSEVSLSDGIERLLASDTTETSSA
ncbi:UDP-glucose 4-epimerase [Haloferax mucosum ATCC BAA-1512]|uniref:UDP-glucose 4-epimerase n=1 Tax=Haloferax mucosum ATCC BAA-1512 TaxID=662479 RepID=M0IMT0_9EURY|nr:NAD-dependent epimerase/dehydratase family protein [Haloferax mucosum]ELZ98015.1 UDP-glucose 4-epimerase [Haloferax mucosum ATCC BAA-1512]